MSMVILGVICVISLALLGVVVVDHRKADARTRDSLLEIISKITVPAEIPIEAKEEVVHSAEYMPEVELDEWMNGMGMVPMQGGWGPPGGTIPEEWQQPSELPEP